MPIIIPTLSLEKLKKFPTQAFIAVLLIMLGYFINSSNKDKEENKQTWKERALNDERKLDSINQSNSKFKDDMIQELELRRQGAEKIDSVARTIVKLKAKKLVKK